MHEEASNHAGQNYINITVRYAAGGIHLLHSEERISEDVKYLVIAIMEKKRIKSASVFRIVNICR